MVKDGSYIAFSAVLSKNLQAYLTAYTSMLNKQHIIFSAIIFTGWILFFVYPFPSLSLICNFYLLPSMSYYRDVMVVQKKVIHVPQKRNSVKE